MSDAHLVRFAPGSGTAFVAPDRLAFTAGDGQSPTARALRALVVRRAPLEDVMTELSRLGFGALEAFAVVVAEQDGEGPPAARLLHRGELAVRVERAEGAALTYHQPQIATWREEVVAGVLSVRVDLGADNASALSFWCDGAAEVPAAGAAWSPRLVHDGDVQPGGPPAAAASGEPLIDLIVDPMDDGSHGVSVPALADAEPARPESGPAVVVAGEADDIDFVNLVHHTVFRTPEDAAVRGGEPPAGGALPPPVAPGVDVGPAAESPVPADATRAWQDSVASGMIDDVPQMPGGSGAVAANVSGDVDPDHDGHTVARRSTREATPLTASAPAGLTRPLVHAVHCPSGHPNPPNAPLCRVCSISIADRAARTEPRPQLGVVRFSTGQTAVIDGPLMIGRNPPSGVELDGESSTAVAIDDSEISRYHLAVRVADWYVSVEDQGSTNGTVVRVPGKPDQTLRPFERVQIVVGTVVDVGGAVTFRYEAT